MTLKGNVQPSDFASDGNLMAQVFKKLLGEASFIELVQVQSVSGNVCSVKPLLAKRDPGGIPIPTVEISDIPYFRLQMGISAIVMKPTVGDIGLLLCCDRDITNILATGKESMVASGFTHSKKDGIYLGGIALLNEAPTEYIEFTGVGVNIVAPSGLPITGDVTMDNKLNVTGDAVMGSKLDVTGQTNIQGTDFLTHTHSGVQAGSSSTGGVNP